MHDSITIKGARQHNLKDIDVTIPKNKLVVFTGLSGSGKSSLAFDTIYAEGQRRYVESLSSYARQFLGIMGKPDVDQIDGLSPAISIDQKTTSHNPRSTVGTITEIYDYLRLLYARVGHPHCPKCGREIQKQSLEQITQTVVDLIVDQAGQAPQVRFLILSPVVRDKKGEFSGLFDNLKAKGFQRVRIDGHMFNLDEDLVLIKTNQHNIDVVVERVTFDKKQSKSPIAMKNLRGRLSQALHTALELSNGLVIASQVADASHTFPDKPTDMTDHLYSEHFACPECNINLPEIEPRIFSFNSPHGACPTCTGLGTLLKIDPHKIIAPELTLSEGAIIPYASMLSTESSWYTRKIRAVVEYYGASMKTPWKRLDQKIKDVLLDGSEQLFTVTGTNRRGRQATFEDSFEGITKNLERRHQETESDFIRHEIERFMKKEACPECQGARLKPESLSVTIDGRNISQISDLSIKDNSAFIKKLRSDKLKLSATEQQIGQLVLREVDTRLDFLVSVGLEYLTLSREAGTLAGGEAQRIRLASQIGTGLTGVLYVLDEPSIGLHQRDNLRLIKTLKNLRDLGNSVLVVEHDRDIMNASDYLVDFGPGAGQHGGTIVAQGTPAQVMSTAKSLTGKYLSGKKSVKGTDIQKQLDKLALPQTNNTPADASLRLSGCTLHNLQNLDVTFPLGKLVVVTGVSGSGKSTLVHDTLYQAVKASLAGDQSAPKHYQRLTGVDYLDRVSLIDQSPIGRTPRSNPATYTKIFDHVRELMTHTKEAKIRGFKPGRFSFNVKGGRCESCQGGGQVKIEMQFMPDVYITCEVCQGARYNHDTLEVVYRGKNISDILHLTVDDALEFFPAHRSLTSKLTTLQDVGLGYIELGQPATTLSGGEAQRVKLAKELSIKTAGHNLYLLDEPTTGLHFEDLKKLLFVLKALVAQNNTVIVIEHNLDIIKNADWIIDLGPEGGDGGGQVVATGTITDIINKKRSYTGQFLNTGTGRLSL